MVQRLLIAVAGASLITSAMLLGMNEVAQHLKERDPTQYFQISSFTPAPESRRPKPPPAPAVPPERPWLDHAQPRDTRVPVTAPSVDPERLAAPPLVPEPSPDAGSD